ncbi:CRISPR-associated endonuclease Cas3'' [Candidatus Halobeggiatoa sp. HSG11]|nr:CRISPR-associated endonuclease Cas3'' [Candidatus Halobeggiatoa sp. HSG11]
MKTYKKYWGKADKDGQYHLLINHCLDVAAVADCWWQQDLALQQTFQRAIKIEPDQLRAWLLFFIALHDLGKFDVRFQLKSRKIALELQPSFAKANQSSSCKFHHGVWGYSWFEIECRKYGFDNYSHEHELEWMLPVASHHGIWVNAERWLGKFADPIVIQYDSQARQQWVIALRELLLAPVGIQTGDEPPKLSESAQHLVAGFCSISDWIGSNQDFFPYDSDDKELDDYLKSRHRNAKKALQDFGLFYKPLLHGGMHIFPKINMPHGIQTLNVFLWIICVGQIM